MAPRTNIESLSDGAAMRALRGLERSFDLHARSDEAEFKALREEQTNGFAQVHGEISSIRRRQGEIHQDMQTILQALSLDKSGTGRKPLALMGQWETVFKLGGAMGGFVILWQMIIAASPSLLAALVAIGHALQAMSHVATR